MKKIEVIKTRNLLSGNPQQGIAPIGFEGVKSTNLSHAKFKNLPKIIAEAEAIESTIKEMASVRYNELKSKLIEVISPLIETVTEQKKAFEIEQKYVSEWEHGNEWKSESALYQQAIDKFLDEDIQLDLHKISFSDLPYDLTDTQFQAISIFITE